MQGRTFEFAARGVRLVNRLPRTVAGWELGRQRVRSATLVGSNVEEADAAESKPDFVHKRSIAHKEARETRHLSVLNDEEVCAPIRESDELVRILYAIIFNARRSSRSKVGC